MPFEGFLVSDKVYRYYRTQDELAHKLDQQIKDLDFCAHDEVSSDNTFLFVGLSLLAGAAAGFYIGHAK